MSPIKDVAIRNFKSLREVGIGDCRRVNLFIGGMGSGKTNLLEALSLFAVDRAYSDFFTFVRYECGKKNLFSLFFDGDGSRPIEVTVNGNTEMLGKLDFREEEYRLDFSSEFASFTVPGNDTVVGNWKLRETAPGGGYLSEVKRYGYGISPYNLVSYMDKSIPDGFHLNYLRGFPEVAEEIRGLFKEFAGAELYYNVGDEHYFLFKWMKDDGSAFVMPYKNAPESLLRLVFYKMAMKINKNSILLFEEPETGLGSECLKRLAADMGSIEECGNQLFATTKSYFLVEELWGRLGEEGMSVYLTERERWTGETVVRKLRGEEVHQYNAEINELNK